MTKHLPIRWLEETDSTQNELARHISEYDNLSVVAARFQTAGRGQRGNTWVAAKGENLTFSMLLKFGQEGIPNLDSGDQFIITRAATLGVLTYLDGKGIPCKIKWPNDIYYRNRKICGMLIENVLDESKRSYTVFPIKDTSKSKAAQDFTDPVVKDQISLAFHPCLSLIDDDQVLSVVHVGQLCGRAHLQRSPSDDQAVCAAYQVNCSLIGFFREEFPVECDVGADHFAADGTSGDYIGAFKDKVFIVLPAAGDAVIFTDRPVDLIDIFAAGFLVQAVDVLCNHTFQLACPL